MLKKLLAVAFAATIAITGVNAADTKPVDKDITTVDTIIVDKEEMALIINAGQRYARELKDKGMSDKEILDVLVDDVENGSCQLIRTRGRNFIIGLLAGTSLTLAACVAVYYFWLKEAVVTGSTTEVAGSGTEVAGSGTEVAGSGTEVAGSGTDDDSETEA